jgi:hypothetical protein
MEASSRLIVNRAIAEVIGELRPAQLQSLKSWQGATSLMPSSQSLLLWVREKMPEYFGQVLTKARQLETEAMGARVKV